MIIEVTELSFSAEYNMIICMLIIALSLSACNRIGYYMISAVRITKVTIVYGIVYGFMARTILTEETMLLGVLFAVLGAYCTVDGLIIPDSFMSLDGITCLMIYGMPALWFMAWKIKSCTVELLTVIMVVFSAFLLTTVIIGMIMSEYMDILSIVTIIICGIIIVEVLHIGHVYPALASILNSTSTEVVIMLAIQSIVGYLLYRCSQSGDWQLDLHY